MRGDKNKNSVKIFSVVLLLVLSLITFSGIVSASYCEIDGDCNDNIKCTTDLCGSGTCKNVAISDCTCSSDSDCHIDDYCDDSTNTCKPKGDIVTGICQGDYVTGCELGDQNVCEQYTVGDASSGSATGCADNAPAGCKEVWDCFSNDEYGQCDRDQTLCSGQPDCALSECQDPSGPPQYCDATFTSCKPFGKTDCQSTDGCEWVEPQQCAAEEIRETSCSGTYYAIEDRCQGQYWICTASGDNPAAPVYNFFSLITGNVIDEDSYYSSSECVVGIGEVSPYPYGCTVDMCNDKFDPTLSDADRAVLANSCNWEPTSVPKSCSALDEAGCNEHSECTLTVNCIEPTCNDNDNGENNPEMVFSSVTYTNSSGTYEFSDKCATDTLLYEQTCSGGTTRNQNTITCDNGCTNGACREMAIAGKELCEVCTQDMDCYSGICREVYGSTTKVCVAENTCAKDTTSSCQVDTLTTICEEDAISTCQTDSSWSTAVPCDNGCASATSCAVPDPRADWVADDNMNQILSVIEIRENLPIVRLALFDSGLESDTFSIKEKDTWPNADDSIQDSLTGTKLADGTIVYSWTITEADLEAADQSNKEYLFYFETASGETSGILNVTDLRSEADPSCGDGFCNATAGETYTTCSADCFEIGDGVCEDGTDGTTDKGEGCSNSKDDCAPCNDPRIAWTQPELPFNEIEYAAISASNILGHKFRMVLQNPSGSQEDFVLKEKDTLGNDLIDEFTGTIDGNGDYVYTWSTKYSNFLDAGETDGDFEFYFEVDGLDNRDKPLVIEIVDGAVPTCSDGVQNGDEEGADCGGSCPEACEVPVCETVNICSEYSTPEACEADSVTCMVANQSVPGGVGADQVALCYWEDDRCDVKKKTIGVGDCNYAEEYSGDTCDDDGFLSYSYDATFIWSPNNEYGPGVAGDADYVYDEAAGVYRYDPERESLKCIPGERTVECPAQIQLSFFTWVNLVAALVLIFVIYLLIADKKKKKAKKKVVKKKTVKKAVSKKPVKKAVKKTTKKKIVKKKK